MLRFSKEQVDGFREGETRDFEDRVLAHMTKYFPAKCLALGEDEARAWIRHGARRAAAHGIRSERGQAKLIALMFKLGRDFDTDPDLPAGALLAKLSGRGETEKVHALYKALADGDIKGA